QQGSFVFHLIAAAGERGPRQHYLTGGALQSSDDGPGRQAEDAGGIRRGLALGRAIEIAVGSLDQCVQTQAVRVLEVGSERGQCAIRSQFEDRAGAGGVEVWRNRVGVIRPAILSSAVKIAIGPMNEILGAPT